jgi:hypothetical protein
MTKFSFVALAPTLAKYATIIKTGSFTTHLHQLAQYATKGNQDILKTKSKY